MRRSFLYGCVAAALSINIFVFIANRRHTPKGYMVRVASDTCLCATHDYRIIHVHLSKDGGMTINTEAVQANKLRTLLSKIYAVRAERVIYLSSDLDVPFERLAEVIDLLQNLQYSTSVLEPPALKDVRPMRVEVRLITTGSVDTRCPTGCVNWVRQPEALLLRRELVRSTAAPIALGFVKVSGRRLTPQAAANADRFRLLSQCPFSGVRQQSLSHPAGDRHSHPI